jgi:uncharacterized protein YkwD
MWMGTTRSRLGRLIAVASLVMVLVAGLSSVAGAGTYKERWLMKRETNESRLYHDVRRLDLNERLSDLARKHSLKMARENDLFHTSNPSSYYLRGIKWHTWGENVGVTGGTVRDLQKAFMHSPPHRANILNRDFRHVAIGAVRANGALWVTVFFYG